MIITPPAIEEYAPYYSTYIHKVKEADLVKALAQNSQTFSAFISALPTNKLEYRYAAGKWTIKEIIVHLADAERIFAYRALRFARKDKTPLAGFDENEYVPESYANERPLTDLLEEWQSVRQATTTLFASVNQDAATRKGLANGSEMSVRALGFAIVGHTMHHQSIIKERYLD